ncbi:MAG: hypothetical protein RL376_1013, partial [Verrucomicrobiota bacterium]
MSKNYLRFLGALFLIGLTGAAHAAPVSLVDEAPVEIRAVAPDVYLVDFGRVAFG